MFKKGPQTQRLEKDFNDLLKTIKETHDDDNGSVTILEVVKNNEKYSNGLIVDDNFDDDFTVAIGKSLNNMEDFTILLRGPSGTPYAGGAFKLRFQTSSNYPFKPPVITFMTKIYHPNINEAGAICLDVISSYSNQWTPLYTFIKVIMSISALLASPNPDDPLRCEAGTLYKTNNKKYLEKAIEETKKYAIVDPKREYMILNQQ